jgi:DNA repair exonuclease SbcCD nuclease subunit
MGRLTKIERFRREQLTQKWREAVFECKGHKCAACNTTKNLEIHHVLPLINGGNNNMDNLLVVCQKHHKQLHGKIHRRTSENGRPKIISYEDALPTLKKYFNEEIGTKECLSVLGFSPTNHTALYEFRKRYKAEFGLPHRFYNKVDLREAAPKRVYKMGQNGGRPPKEKYMFQGGSITTLI